MISTNVRARVQKHRVALRVAGLRPVQIWIPDTRRLWPTKACYDDGPMRKGWSGGSMPIDGASRAFSGCFLGDCEMRRFR